MPPRITKSTGQIVRENVLTRFNLLNFAIAALLFSVGAYSNLAFLAVILVNIGVGISQECRAKKLVDRLSLLNRPHVCVLRGGQPVTVDVDAVAVGDILLLESGWQIPCDAEVISGAIEVNESLLTGESDAVPKAPGAALLSGSSVLSGRAQARVVRTGAESYAARLTEEVRHSRPAQSELVRSIRKVTQLTSFLILPLGALLFWQALVLRGAAVPDAVTATAAALLGMLPKGLVLLISVSLAGGVIRLSKRRVLVQNLYALENLAHADVLCLDKTGTLTDGRLTVQDAVFFSEHAAGLTSAQARGLLSAYLAASTDSNATMQALRRRFGVSPRTDAGQTQDAIPFSSQRKWGAVCLPEGGTVFLGAPERLLHRPCPAAEEWLADGYRVLAAAFCPCAWHNADRLPDAGLVPLAVLCLADTIRSSAADTLRTFAEQGVAVKVISGDHLNTVTLTAQRAGLRHWRDAVDLSALPAPLNYDVLCEQYAVFARVTPRQKQELVKALKRRGHRVAMTGDGVNDLLALREADCSIAVADGSDASRQAAQLVLLDSDFAQLPQVVLEGRRVINNVTRTAGVFFIKTIYSVLLSAACLVFNLPFPFIPLQITLIDAAMEAWPSFLTILESDTRRPRGRFLSTALCHAFPFAFAATGMMLFARLFLALDTAQAETVMYLLLLLTTAAAVLKSCLPMTRLRAFLCLSMAAGTCAALALFPRLLRLAPLSPHMALLTVGIGLMGAVIAALTARLIRAAS